MANKEEELSFDKITQIYKAEKDSQKLVELPPRFYHLFDEYVAGLKGEQAAKSGDSPDSPEVAMLGDEIKKSSQRMKQIRELRERKIALIAVLKANGSKKEEEMTPEEEALLKDIVKVIRSYKDVAYKTAKPAVPLVIEKKELAAEQTEPAAKAQKAAQEEAKPEAQQKAEKSQQTLETAARNIIKYKYVQILETIPPFVGEDTTYALAKEDVVALPCNLADLLCSRGKAIELKTED